MTGNVHKEDNSIVNFPQDAIQEDRGLSTCGVPQKVLASISDVISYKNDRTAIAYKFDTMTIELEDSSGAVTAAAGIAVVFPNQTDAKGWVIDWRQVLNGLGALAQDCYRVRVNWTLSGNSGWFYHGSYQLQEYSVFNARGTVRLYVVLNDLVRKQGINYKDSGFAGTVRFEGMFGFMQPNYDTENNTHTNRERFKVRNEALRTYELHTSFLLRCQTRLIDEDTLLAANHIWVTDHNAGNHDTFYDFPVILSEEESPSFEYPIGVYAKITAKFLDKVAYHESKYDGNIAGSDNVILQLPTAVSSCPNASYLVQYDNLTPIQSGTVASGGSVTVNVPNPVVAVPQRKTAKLMKTGALPFVAGDDGNIQRGRLTDWLTLSVVPVNDDGSPTLNTTLFRFTDEFGGQTFTSGIILDWSTWDGTNINMWQDDFLLHSGYDTLDFAETFCDAFTLAGFSGWKQCNNGELMSVCKDQYNCFNYPPFNSTAVNFLWSNTRLSATIARRVRQDTASFDQSISAANNARPFPIRIGTITGTTLS